MEKEKYCAVCKKCSGCQLSNLDYSQQIKLKQSMLRSTFKGLIKPNRIIEAPSPFNYRNKAQLVFKKQKGKTHFGIYRSADCSIAVTDNCPLHTDRANRVSRELCRLFDKYRLTPYDFRQRSGFIRSAVLREGFASGEMLVNITASKNTFPKEAAFAAELAEKHPYVKGVVISESQSAKLTSGGNPRVIYGREFINDTLCKLNFKIGYNTFYQINPMQTEVLYNEALRAARLKSDDCVLDAYCGIGTISLAAAKQCRRVIGVELNPDSIKNARENATANGIQNADFFAEDVKKQIKLLLDRNQRFDVCFIDPPRAGCELDFLKSLVSTEVNRIVYISCNIETQARDLRYLIKHGYEIHSCQGVDMFPYTKHIECVVLMSKVQK